MVEVRRCGPGRDQAHVHVEPVAGSHDVAQQPPVLIDTVGGRFGESRTRLPSGSSRLVWREAARP
jgi:hypothetical protein